MKKKSLRIVIADNESIIRMDLREMLEDVGHEVVGEAVDGWHAVEITRSRRPDLVIMDIKMPEMDGIELIARLREQNPSALCVIVSGYSDFEYARAAIQNSAVDYLLKPVNPEELSALLKRLETMLMAREQALAPRREASAGEVVENVMLYLRQNYDRQIDFAAVAEAQAVSAPYLSKLFHDHAGTSPSRYLTDLRMQKAKKLLLDSQLSIKEIAARVGYPDPFHFSKSFKNAVGMSPAQFRDRRDDGVKA